MLRITSPPIYDFNHIKPFKNMTFIMFYMTINSLLEGFLIP